MKMNSILRYTSYLMLLILLAGFAFSQGSDAGGDEFKAALRAYIEKQLTGFGIDAIKKERFLVQQMRMLNDEIKTRVTNVNEIKSRYFEGLETRLAEIQTLKKRISAGGNNSLLSFTNELESRIKQTINEGRIDFQRQKVFEDGIQLLYIAEEVMDLDPNARLDQDPKISAKMADSRKEFINTFGGTEYLSARSTTPGGEQPTIFDLFKEWKNTHLVKFETRWTDVQIIKNRLLRDGAPIEKERMFKRELRYAVMAYNFRDYDLAERMFEELLIRYNFLSDLDDIYYYRGEANYNLGRYHSAQEAYLQLVQLYPVSIFASKAYHKLIKIAYHFEDPVKVAEYYQNFERIAATSDPLYGEARLIYGLSSLDNARYENAAQALSAVSALSPYYHEAQYLLAQAYCGADNINEAENILRELIKGSRLTPDFRFNVLLKLGYIKFEKGEYLMAVNYFDQIAGTFPFYDRVLIGYSWAFYRLELAKPYDKDKPRELPMAKKYLRMLIDNFPVSEYVLEAKSLMGYIYQLEMKPEAAISQFNYTYRTRHPKEFSDQMIAERDSLKETLRQTEYYAEKALVNNNPPAYYKAKGVNDRLLDTYMQMSYRDLSSSGVAVRNEVVRISEQLKELERLRVMAVERDNQALIKRIDGLQERLQYVLKETPLEESTSPLGVNYFDAYPSARKESVIESNNNKVLVMRASAADERESLNQELAALSAEIERARSRKDYKQLAQLELRYNKLKEISKKYDYLDTYAHSLALKQSNINLEKWSDYGAFGIANVNFEIKRNKGERLSYYNQQVIKINKILNSRKNILEYKIAQIEGEVNVMTRRVRRQEREREREELNRRFEESYFDTHTTEFENTTTEPPSFDDENNQ
jgi:TolA-binding protein